MGELNKNEKVPVLTQPAGETDGSNTSISPGNWGELQWGDHAKIGVRELGFGKQASGGLHEEVCICRGPAPVDPG